MSSQYGKISIVKVQGKAQGQGHYQNKGSQEAVIEGGSDFHNAITLQLYPT
jgi:hypothetical protein